MKKIAVLTDLSGLGRCSLAAALPVLSVMGHECVAVPTAVLSAQTAFEGGFCRDMTQDIPLFSDSFDKIGVGFDAILSGFMTCEEQVRKVAAFVDRFKKVGTLFVCDPVMGDDGELYKMFDRGIVDAMRGLCELSDVITPNLTELCLLADVPYGDMSDQAIVSAANSLGEGKTVVVTGVLRGDDTCVFVVEGDKYALLRSKYIGGSFSGTGDLFSAALCGGIMRGESAKDAADTARQFIFKAVCDTAASEDDRKYGINFQKYLKILV